MRTRVEIKWFAACATLAEVQSLYRKLVMEHHPDRGGDVRKMQEINAEHDALVRDPSRIGTARPGGWESEWERAHEQSRRKERTWEDFEGAMTPKPGRYTVRIKSIRENAKKKYVAIVFDIDSGKHVGHFEGMLWHKHCVYLRYGNSEVLAESKDIIDKINRSNAGFDGDSAFCNDRAYEFVGKRFSLNLTEENIRGNGYITFRQVFAV